MSLGDSATPIGKVRALGSARRGGQEWYADKVESAALVMLSVWLVASLLLLPDFDRATMVQWLRAPSGAVPMALFVILSFHHALHGMKMVLDDYIHEEANNFFLNALMLFVAVGGAAWALFALARIAFGGQA